MNGRRSQSILTVGYIAQICGVSPRTASMWIDKGILKGYRIPGSHARRARAEDVKRFIVEYGLGVPAEVVDKIGKEHKNGQDDLREENRKLREACTLFRKAWILSRAWASMSGKGNAELRQAAQEAEVIWRELNG